jgi:hypothetical protein
MSARISLVVALAAVLALPVPGVADDASEARFFNDWAADESGHARFDDALGHLLLANAVAHNPRGLYNLALVAEAAGRHAMAYSFYEEYLRSADTDPAMRRDAARRADDLHTRLALVAVASDPPGATISVNRPECGDFGVTPRTIALEILARPGSAEVAPCGAITSRVSDVRLTLSADGYLAAERSVRVTVGETARPAPVRLEPRRGILEVHVTPATAEIVVRGTAAEPVAARSGEPSSLPVGAYRIEVVAPGHERVVREVTVVEGRATVLRLDASPLPEPSGTIQVASRPQGATVFVDDVRTAVTPASLRLTTRRHRIRIESHGFAPWSGALTPAEGRTVFQSVTLVKTGHRRGEGPR